MRLVPMCAFPRNGLIDMIDMGKVLALRPSVLKVHRSLVSRLAPLDR